MMTHHVSKPCETLPCPSDVHDLLLASLLFISIALPIPENRLLISEILVRSDKLTFLSQTNLSTYGKGVNLGQWVLLSVQTFGSHGDCAVIVDEGVLVDSVRAEVFRFEIMTKFHLTVAVFGQVIVKCIKFCKFLKDKSKSLQVKILVTSLNSE